MALQWPDAEAVKRLLDITSEDFDDDVEQLRAASVRAVQRDCGLDEADPPATENQAAAALRACVLLRPNSNDGLDGLHKDRVYNGLLFGERKRFGIA